MKLNLKNLERPAYSLLLLAIGLFAAFDAMGDLSSGSSPTHIALELTLGLLALGGAGILLSRFRILGKHLTATHQQLKESQDRANKWQAQHADLVRGLGAAIDRQFQLWSLSPSEKEVALLLLKGLGLKEIATIRNTSERTVRQQSLSVYSKAALKGRAELSAFFLEDLILPPC